MVPTSSKGMRDTRDYFMKPQMGQINEDANENTYKEGDHLGYRVGGQASYDSYLDTHAYP